MSPRAKFSGKFAAHSEDGIANGQRTQEKRWFSKTMISFDQKDITVRSDIGRKGMITMIMIIIIWFQWSASLSTLSGTIPSCSLAWLCATRFSPISVATRIVQNRTWANMFTEQLTAEETKKINVNIFNRHRHDHHLDGHLCFVTDPFLVPCKHVHLELRPGRKVLNLKLVGGCLKQNQSIQYHETISHHWNSVLQWASNQNNHCKMNRENKKRSSSSSQLQIWPCIDIF